MSRTVSMQFGKPGGVVQNGGFGEQGNQYVLLWENPEPTSNFAAQTIPLDLSKYPAALIVARIATNSDATGSFFGFIGEEPTITIKGATSNTIYGRRTVISETGVEFLQGYAGGTAGAGNAIPIKIYGVYTAGVRGATGAKGDTGVSIDSVTLASGTHAPGTDDTYNVNLDNGTVGGTFTVHNGADGEDGTDGTDGVGISSVTKASGSGAPGTNDTYNVNLTDGTVGGTFSVHNGADGQGSPGSQLPLADGTASAGSANAYSREDHVHPKSTTQSLTPTITKTSGNSSVDSVSAVRYGNVIQVYAKFISGNAVSTGNNTFVGTLSGIPLPAISVVGASYIGSSALLSGLDPDGSFVIRVLAAQKTASSTSTFGLSWTYICA